jgi:hypothetical protein
MFCACGGWSHANYRCVIIVIKTLLLALPRVTSCALSLLPALEFVLLFPIKLVQEFKHTEFKTMSNTP